MTKVTTHIIKNTFDEYLSRERKSIDNVFGDFLVNKSLYDEIEITKDNIFELADLVGGHVKIDIYCSECRESRMFSCEMIPYYWYDNDAKEIKGCPLEREIILLQQQQIQNMKKPHFADEPEEPWTWTNNSLENDTRLMVFKFFCAMDNTHNLDYIVLTYGSKMKKIGQYPSVADLSLPELKEYRKVMTKEDERELKRAIGLFASGIGVGSFVYLRRIFERIIVTAGKKAIEEEKIKEERFNKAHVDEKIKMLARYLPKSLVNNTIFYGIISKGIHELSEEDCLEFFPVMKSFIMMILRQWENMRRDKEEEKELAYSLSNIAARVK
ncbi:MAG: hypothetical protein HFH68_13315 [Lachnospiraceae bacterium]|nr:hypothetical protein [Lachnospiraceae bacterium]